MFEVYTDGSHKGKWGSWAFVVVKNNKVFHEASGRVRYTDSHRMEFQAAIEALYFLDHGSVAHFYSDSQILIKCATRFPNLAKSNGDQIKILHELLALQQISWHWVRAHSGNVQNERCDQLCAQARTGRIS